MRADRRQGEHFRRRKNHRAARRERIRRGAGRRTDDQPVAAVTSDEFAVHADVERDEARHRATADDDVVEPFR